MCALQIKGKKTRSKFFVSSKMHPLPAASIGQVHVGYLRGRKVAIKVQRPSVDTDFAGDIRLMMATIQLIKRLHLRFVYWMIEPVSEFVGWTKEELDYRYEARYMEQLCRNSRDNLHEFFPNIRRHTTLVSDWSSDVCSSD